MSELQRETLSAMLDDETDELELRRLLKSAGDDPDLLAAWQRYHLASAVARRERVASLSKDFHLRLAGKLRDEPVPGLAPRRWPSGQRFAGKFAIAATVAAAVFIGLQAGLDSGPAAPRIVGETAAAPAARPVAPVDAPVPRTVEVANVPTAPVDPEARQRLLEYIGSMRFDPAEPPQMEHIEDSPLFHLVNDLQD